MLHRSLWIKNYFPKVLFLLLEKSLRNLQEIGLLPHLKKIGLFSDFQYDFWTPC